MPSVEGLKRKLQQWTPKVQSAFIVYITPRESPVKETVSEFEIVEVTSPEDPLFDAVVPTWQRKVAQKSVAAKEWRIIVACKDGKPIGRIWETYATERRLFSGIPRVRLGHRESFMFDLFVEREYRRSNVGMTMADWFFQAYVPGVAPVDYIYGFINYDNAPSILWHHSIGFNVVQTINYLAIGDRIKWKIPFSDVPRFGPMSRRGRHTDPDKELFGTSLFPNL